MIVSLPLNNLSLEQTNNNTIKVTMFLYQQLTLITFKDLMSCIRCVLICVC